MFSLYHQKMCPLSAHFTNILLDIAYIYIYIHADRSRMVAFSRHKCGNLPRLLEDSDVPVISSFYDYEAVVWSCLTRMPNQTHHDNFMISMLRKLKQHEIPWNHKEILYHWNTIWWMVVKSFTTKRMVGTLHSNNAMFATYQLAQDFATKHSIVPFNCHLS